MQDRNITGKKGEEMAVLFLKKIGFRIIALNWRYKNLEVDIIAYDKDVLVFVEVKVRNTSTHALPNDVISPSKRSRIFKAAQIYLDSSGHQGELRFDVVTFIDNKLDYIKDAFWKY